MKKILTWIDNHIILFCILYYIVVLIIIYSIHKYEHRNIVEHNNIDSFEIINNNLHEELIRLDSIQEEYRINAENLSDSDAVNLFWELLQK